MTVEELLKRATRFVSRSHIDVGDDEILSAIGFGVLLAIRSGVEDVAAAASSLALIECRKAVFERSRNALGERDVGGYDSRYVAFSDGHRFATVPWSQMDRAALELGLERPAGLDHYVCSSVPKGAVTVLPAIFDQLLGTPTDRKRGAPVHGFVAGTLGDADDR